MSILIHFLTLQIIKTILERGTVLRLCIDNISPNDSTGNLRKFSDVTKWGIQCALTTEEEWKELTGDVGLVELMEDKELELGGLGVLASNCSHPGPVFCCLLGVFYRGVLGVLNKHCRHPVSSSMSFGCLILPPSQPLFFFSLPLWPRIPSFDF